MPSSLSARSVSLVDSLHNANFETFVSPHLPESILWFYGLLLLQGTGKRTKDTRSKRRERGRQREEGRGE